METVRQTEEQKARSAKKARDEKIQKPETNYLSDQTVGEMGDQDQDNFKYIMQHRTFIKKFEGRDPTDALGKAMKFSGACVDKILRHHGFKMKPWMMKHPKQLETRLKDQKLRIETRRYPPDEEIYQTGIYILKLRAAGDGDMIDHEIVGFVSEPFVYRPPGIKVVMLYPEICIRTTHEP